MRKVKLLTLILLAFSLQGISQTVTNTVTYDGSGSNDPDGTIVSYQWTKISGPSGDVLTNQTTSKLTIVYNNPGVYTYQLKVTDNVGAIGLDTVKTTVIRQNQAPKSIINGGDRTIQLPGTETSMTQVSGTPMETVRRNTALILKQIAQNE